MGKANTDSYLLGTGAAPLLGAEEEASRARRLREIRTALWRELLRHREGPKTILAELRRTDADHAKRLAGRLRRLQRHPSDRAEQSLLDDLWARDVNLELARRVIDRIDNGATPRTLHAQYLRLKHQFVLANLGLVFKVAGRYRTRHMSFHDVVQEGALGLMRAVDMFDPERGFRFSTYAVWWIRHAIGRALADRARTIRVPVHIVNLQGKLVRERERLTEELGRPPTQPELAAACRVSAERIALADHALGLSITSIDQPRDPQTQQQLELPSEDPTDALHMQLSAVQVEPLLDMLDSMEADVVRKRFGFHEQDPMTLQEIGEEYALSRERIRQIELKAIKKLRSAFAPELTRYPC